MSRDLKSPKRTLVTSRSNQIAKRARDVDASQIKNADFISQKIEGLYTKGMAHDSITMVGSASDAAQLKRALDTQDQGEFDNIQRAGARKLASPQSSLSVELSGADPEGVTMRACDALNGRETAAEMVEVYAKALLRDKPFSQYEDGSVEVQEIINELNSFGEDFKGPKDENGMVTAKNLFRGVAPGCVVGGYISQLLLHPIGIGNYTIQPVGPTKVGKYGITKANYLEIQDGNVPVEQALDEIPKYMYNGAQLGSTVHIDLVFQHFYEAAAILLNAGVSRNSAFPSPVNEGAFLTMGGPAELTPAIAEVSRHALKAAWVQKWRKHSRLRPEACAARVVAELEGHLPEGTVHADLKNSMIVQKIADANDAENMSKGIAAEGRAFLPLQYAEGSPTHPSYPAGHAAIAGACATILKIYLADGAWSTTGLSELQATVDGSNVEAYSGTDAGQTTIHFELNKLAANISIGRNIAGVHYRIDGDEGMVLGEKVAIQYFKDMRDMQNEKIGKISLVKFDGTTEII